MNKTQIVISVCLAIAGWFMVETYSQAQRLSALEEDRSIHMRQDAELQEIRGSIQDIIILFFKEETNLTPIYADTNPDEGFSAAQADLRHLRETKR